MSILDKKYWLNKIKDPHWYFEIPELIDKLKSLHDIDRNAYEKEKEGIYDFFEEQLKLGNITLGLTGKNQDEGRKPIDTVIIHHTSNIPGLSKERLSAIELVRLYAPQYVKEGYIYDENGKIKINPIHSSHFRNGIQVFWPYHWIVRENGICERLLNDNEIGWQAGNWDINCRSVAICIDDDHEKSIPDEKELKVIADLVKNNYPNISKDRIFGHCEINTKTNCPSELFLSIEGRKGWKEDLIGLF